MCRLRAPPSKSFLPCTAHYQPCSSSATSVRMSSVSGFLLLYMSDVEGMTHGTAVSRQTVIVLIPPAGYAGAMGIKQVRPRTPPLPSVAWIPIARAHAERADEMTAGH